MNNMTADYADRMRYLVSEAGSLRAAAKKTGIPRTTLTRIIKGKGGVSKRTRDRVNRKYRNTAPDAVKKREKAGLGSGSALVDERTARVLERSLRAQGISYKVSAHGTYKRSIRAGVLPTTEREWGRGSSVDEAKKNLNANFDRVEARYPNWKIEPNTKILYRVYPVKEASA